MKKLLAIGSLLALLALPVAAQTVPTPTLPTNTAWAPLNYLIQLWPVIDVTQTNSFKSGEMFVDVASLWKSQFASGTTPYLSVAPGYFFTKNVGAEIEIVTLGNGNGSSDVNSVSALMELRKDMGNVAGYLLIGGGLDNGSPKKGMGEVGLGVAYRSTVVVPGLESFVDTRLTCEGTQSDQTGFLTRVGIKIHF